MAFVQGCTHDVFVSYCSCDDCSLVDGDPGWVTNLKTIVERLLHAKLGKSVSVFMDHSLTGNDSLSNQLLAAASESALLLVVVSAGYLESEWCLRERDGFLQSAKARAVSRIFVVEPEPIDDSIRPQELRDKRGYRFWEKHENSSVITLGRLGMRQAEQEYFQRANDLACQIAEELRKIRTGSSMMPEETVYLAEVTDDLEPRRAEVRRYLEQAGYRVLPACWLPRAPQAFVTAAAQDIAKARLFVQLLSGTVGVHGPDLPRGYSWAQLEEAQRLGKPILQWRAPDLDLLTVSDAEQRKLLQTPTVRAEGLEEFKRAVQNLLSAPSSPVPPPTNSFVFIDSEASDEDLARQVCQIVSGLGLDYAEPYRGADPTRLREDIEENLRDCDAVLLLYGTTPVDWVHSHLRECRKIRAQRDRPLNVLALVEGPPPEPKEPVRISLHGMKTLDCRSGIFEAQLRQVLKSA